MVLSCPTTNAHMHCFLMAHKRPHFVFLEQNMASCISKAVAAASGMPKMIIHSRNCLSLPITTNNADSSLNFHMHSDQTEEFSNHFVLIKTDFRWWMQTFDELNAGEKNRSTTGASLTTWTLDGPGMDLPSPRLCHRTDQKQL